MSLFKSVNVVSVNPDGTVNAIVDGNIVTHVNSENSAVGDGIAIGHKVICPVKIRGVKNQTKAKSSSFVDSPYMSFIQYTEDEFNITSYTISGTDKECIRANELIRVYVDGDIPAETVKEDFTITLTSSTYDSGELLATVYNSSEKYIEFTSPENLPVSDTYPTDMIALTVGLSSIGQDTESLVSYLKVGGAIAKLRIFVSPERSFIDPLSFSDAPSTFPQNDYDFENKGKYWPDYIVVEGYSNFKVKFVKAARSDGKLWYRVETYLVNPLNISSPNEELIINNEHPEIKFASGEPIGPYYKYVPMIEFEINESRIYSISITVNRATHPTDFDSQSGVSITASTPPNSTFYSITTTAQLAEPGIETYFSIHPPSVMVSTLNWPDDGLFRFGSSGTLQGCGEEIDYEDVIAQNPAYSRELRVAARFGGAGHGLLFFLDGNLALTLAWYASGAFPSDFVPTADPVLVTQAMQRAAADLKALNFCVNKLPKHKFYEYKYAHDNYISLNTLVGSLRLTRPGQKLDIKTVRFVRFKEAYAGSGSLPYAANIGGLNIELVYISENGEIIFPEYSNSNFNSLPRQNAVPKNELSITL